MKVKKNLLLEQLRLLDPDFRIWDLPERVYGAAKFFITNKNTTQALARLAIENFRKECDWVDNRVTRLVRKEYSYLDNEQRIKFLDDYQKWTQALRNWYSDTLKAGKIDKDKYEGLLHKRNNLFNKESLFLQIGHERLTKLIREHDKKIADLARKPAGTGENATPAKRRGIWIWVKRIPRWIYYILGALAALLTVLHLLGCLEAIKSFIQNINWSK